MHRAPPGDLQQVLPLCLFQLTMQLQLPLDTFNLAVLLIAVVAVFGVDLLMRETHYHVLQLPLLAACIHLKRHAGAGA